MIIAGSTTLSTIGEPDYDILQRLLLKQSETRESINGLLGVDAQTEEQKAELVTLTAAAQELEPSIRAALIAAPDPQEVTTVTGDSESRERIELRAKTGLADFLRAAAGGTSVSGAAAEYATSLGVPTVGSLTDGAFWAHDDHKPTCTPFP